MISAFLNFFKKPISSLAVATTLYTTFVKKLELMGGPPKDSAGRQIFSDYEYRLFLLAYLWGILSVHRLKGVQWLLAAEFAKDQCGTKETMETAQKCQELLRECIEINRFLRDTDFENVDFFYFKQKIDRPQKEIVCGLYMKDHSELNEFVEAMMKKFKIADPPGMPWNSAESRSA